MMYQPNEEEQFDEDDKDSVPSEDGEAEDKLLYPKDLELEMDGIDLVA